MKIRTKIAKLQMHENLHKHVNENVFIHIFMQMFMSFYEEQLKQQICNSFTRLRPKKYACFRLHEILK